MQIIVHSGKKKTEKYCKIVLLTQFNPKNSTQNPFSDGERCAKLAFKWNVGRKQGNLSRIEYRNQFALPESQKIPLKICLRMVRDCQIGILNGILAENRRSAQSGKIKNMIEKLYSSAIRSPKIHSKPTLGW